MSASASSHPRTPPLDWVRETGVVDLVLQDIQAKLVHRRRRRTRATAAALSLVLLVTFAFWAVPYARDTKTILTPAAHRQILMLVDGSTAQLNAQTDVRTDFRYGRRTVRMERGEAFFSVAKDQQHPFLVETPGGVVRVTGTKFNVRLAADGRPVVTLLEGAVSLQSEGTPPVALLPGQQFDPARADVRALAPAELSAATAWREGRLVLDGLTLAEAVSRMADYHGTQITLAPGVSSLRMGGSCALDDLAGFLDFLPRALSVQVLRRSDGSYRILAR